MIIECQTCHARFRLDESRIKGRGARVKCRKCGNGIVVIKDAAPPAAPGPDGFFDLGSAVREVAGDRPTVASPVGNLIPFPSPPGPEPSPGPEPPPSRPNASVAEKDEVDLAFDRFLATDRETSVPPPVEKAAESIASPEAGAPAEPFGGTEPTPEQDPGGLTLDLGPEEKLDLPPVPDMPTFGEAPAVSSPAESVGEGGFLISDSDTLDFLREQDRGAVQEAPPRVGDISMEISATPASEPVFFPREPAASPSPSEDTASTTSAGESLRGKVVPEPTHPAAGIAPGRESEPAPVSPAASTPYRTTPEPEPPRARFSPGRAVAVAAVFLLAAGGYLGLTASGRNALEKMAPGIGALLGGKPGAVGAPKYDLRNVIGYYESGDASPRILVIKGQVANLSKTEKNGIRVHATLLDNTDAVIARQAVYAGNTLSGETIRKGSRESMSKTLENRFGEGLANMSVGPGKAIPFMVVFFDAPPNIDGYKLEAKDAE